MTTHSKHEPVSRMADMVPLRNASRIPLTAFGMSLGLFLAITSAVVSLPAEEAEMSGEASAYGLWALVVINSAVFILFAFSFFKPKTKRDWRSFGAFSAFLVALFTEMYGFPLTLYLFSGWLQSRYPGIDWFTHDAGHLTEMLFGWEANPHFGPFHLLSFVLIGGGFALIAAAWRVLFAAQRAGSLAVTGPYARIRHPQYAGFILIMLGFLVQWPTLLTLAMFPVLVWMYVRLARQEERQALAHFGTVYAEYQRRVPAFVPRLVGSAGGGSPSPGGSPDTARKNRKLAPGKELGTEKGRLP